MMTPEIVHRIHHEFFLCTPTLFLDPKMFAFLKSHLFVVRSSITNWNLSILPSGPSNLPFYSEPARYFSAPEPAFLGFRFSSVMTAELY